jgi:DNA-binding NarL/FixJ family response regulator
MVSATDPNRLAPPEAASAAPILIVDDDASARAEVASALERLRRPLTEAATAEQAIEAAERERPAAVITEVLLPAISGYELCRVLKDRYGSGLPIIFVSGLRTHPADRVAGLLIGADDYLVKPVQPDELLVRVRHLMEHSQHTNVERAGLTLREQEVLGLLTDGFQQGEIAERLVITQRTVGKHVEHILHKLGVHTRTQAVAVALRHEPNF